MEIMVKCLYCGAQIADDRRFCFEYGKQIPQGINVLVVEHP